MSTPKIKRHNKKPITTKRLLQLLKQHLFDTGMVTAYVSPPFTVDEHAEARFKANAIGTQLHAGASPEEEGPLARIAALTEVTMYRARVQGVIAYLEAQVTASKKGVANDTDSDNVQ